MLGVSRQVGCFFDHVIHVRYRRIELSKVEEIGCFVGRVTKASKAPWWGLYALAGLRKTVWGCHQSLNHATHRRPEIGQWD
jgi:hypothetical protein